MIGSNRIKSWVLIASLMGLFVVVGAVFAGREGATIAFGIALLLNLGAYWFSDRIAIMATRSRPVSEQEAPELYQMVRELAAQAQAPVPRLYISDMPQPNAFATGRNPNNAAVAVTRGILQILDRRELRAVLAHELSHVLNRDILLSSIAAAIGSAFTYLAYMLLFAGGGRGGRSSPFGPFGFLLLWFLAPLAAGLIRMAISRTREYQADESGAQLSQDPEALASALQKMEDTAKRVPAEVNPAQAHMFIVNPLRGGRGGGMASLFSTHPPTQERIRRLREIGTRLR